MDVPSSKLHAAALLALFVVVAIANGLVTSGVGVPLTNVDLADTHPNYLLPIGWAFSIWGIIYLLIAVFSVYQLVYSEDAVCAAVRPWAAIALLSNVGWLYLFAYELFWIALLVILCYLLALYKAVGTVSFDPILMYGAEGYRSALLSSVGFSANASWVTVATLLQLCINLQEEGYHASEDLSCGLLMLAVAAASYAAYMRCDFAWALVAAWALFGIVANQASGSAFGCVEQICNPTCVAGEQSICSNGRAAPLGWASSCDGSLDDDAILVPKSAKVAACAGVGVGIVALALSAGVVRAVLRRRAGPSSATEVVVKGSALIDMHNRVF